MVMSRIVVMSQGHGVRVMSQVVSQGLWWCHAGRGDITDGVAVSLWCQGWCHRSCGDVTGAVVTSQAVSWGRGDVTRAVVTSQAVSWGCGDVTGDVTGCWWCHRVAVMSQGLWWRHRRCPGHVTVARCDALSLW